MQCYRFLLSIVLIGNLFIFVSVQGKPVRLPDASTICNEIERNPAKKEHYFREILRLLDGNQMRGYLHTFDVWNQNNTGCVDCQHKNELIEFARISRELAQA